MSSKTRQQPEVTLVAIGQVTFKEKSRAPRVAWFHGLDIHKGATLFQALGAHAGAPLPRYEEGLPVVLRGLPEDAEAGSRAASDATVNADGSEWRVGVFWSSANPGQKVKVVAEGRARIEEWQRRTDFIQWVAAAPTDNGTLSEVPGAPAEVATAITALRHAWAGDHAGAAGYIDLMAQRLDGSGKPKEASYVRSALAELTGTKQPDLVVPQAVG